MATDLHRVVQSKQVLSINHIKCFMKQIVEGVKAMHEVGILHRKFQSKIIFKI